MHLLLRKLIEWSVMIGIAWVVISVSQAAQAAESQSDTTEPNSTAETDSIPLSESPLSDPQPLPSLLAQKETEIDAYLAAYREIEQWSGNVLIRQGSGPALVRSDGLANHEHGVANTADTKFRIGSVTKQFTAVAILQLQEKGLLDVQAPVSTYLKDYPGGDGITVHQLLLHTAGIPEYLDSERFPDLMTWMRSPATAKEIRDRTQNLPLDFEPGSEHKYSNSGYVLLTEIIETLSQQSYADYVRTQILEPLGMTNSGYEVPQTIIPHLAQGYLYLGKDILYQALPMDMTIPQGAGGLYSTVGDLAIWNQWLYGEADNSETGDSPANSPTANSPTANSPTLNTPILSPVAKAQLMASAVDITLPGSAETAYGYGLVSDTHLNRQRLFHSGGISGFASFLAYYPTEQLTIASLSNFETALPGEVASTLAAIVLGEPYELPQSRVMANIDRTVYQDYVGTYQLLPEMVIEIRVEAGELVAQATGQDSFTLLPSSTTDFYGEAVDITIAFARDENGTVEGFIFNQLGQELFAPKINK
jgi:CubicO group peptidase (beta-lactamase class C family)